MATKSKRAAGGRSAGVSRAKSAGRKRAASAHGRQRTSHAGAGANVKSSKRKAAKKWSAGVMARSDAMDLETGVFKSRSARQVALSLKRSAESSHRRKSTPFRSAMSMLNFEINRGGKNLSAQQRKVLNAAKVELRKVFHREPARP
jgi:Protein of unknown function (DUF3175)